MTKIIEIKGYWDHNSDKLEVLTSLTDAECIIITNINSFIEEDSNYHAELSNWKTLNGKN